MKKANIQLETLTCPSCLIKIEKALKSLEGINKESIQVLFNSSKVKVEYEEQVIMLEQITKAINQVGYEVLKVQSN